MLDLNNCLSIASTGGSEPTHGRSGSVQRYHSHLNLNSLLETSRSRIPKPPNFLVRMVLHQLTRQCAPFVSASPFHRKLLLSLSIFLIPHFGNLKTVRKYVGKDDNTELTSFNLPARFRSFPFQLANVPPTLSIKGWMSTLPIALMCSGKPKYLHGKLFIGQLKASIICSS